jgi:spore coat polysaccharide biosynthesis protein SpsF
VRVILQARVTSKRLPGKVLLPVAGIPLALLCAKRLGNTGLEVVVATSCDDSDDVLTEIIRPEFKVFRGSLNDVLGRFVGAADELREDDIVVRATADNPLPDGTFVTALIDRFLQHNVAYYGTDFPSDGLPYGATVEVFSVRQLRLRDRLSISKDEREHVTTIIRSSNDARLLVQNDLLKNNYSHLRSTVDVLEDYLLISKLFDGVRDAVSVSWRELVCRLNDGRSCDEFNVLAKNSDISSKLCLGTAQLGMKYGITNNVGHLTDNEAHSLIKLARLRGVSSFDTARSYGLAERRLGDTLWGLQDNSSVLVTKLNPLPLHSDAMSESQIIQAIDASVYCSCYQLNRRKLDVLMFHRSQDIFKWTGTAINHVEKLAADGLIGEIGVSVYSPDEAIRCMSDVRINHIQIPFNLFDRRWIGNEFQSALKSRPNLSVYARSIFLQGLLINDSINWPHWVLKKEDYVRKISDLCCRLNCGSPVELCVAYAKAFPWISKLVVGVDSIKQLDHLLASFNRSPLSGIEVNEIHKELSDIPDRLLDPRLW